MPRVHAPGSDSDDMNGATTSKARRKRLDSDEEASADEGDQEEEASEYEIEEILDARRGMYPEGRIGYLVKWKGYGDSENSWVDEQDAGNAGDLVAEYWKKQQKKKPGPKKSLDPKVPKKPRKLTAQDDTSEGDSASTRKRGRVSNVSLPSDAEEEEPQRSRLHKKARNSASNAKKRDIVNIIDDQDTVIKDMSRYMSVASWEELVNSVDTVERAEDGELIVYFALHNGDRVKEKSIICAERFPRKLIQFYERNLKWRTTELEEE